MEKPETSEAEKAIKRLKEAQIRGDMLNRSLFIESMSGIMLSWLLGIQEADKTLSFGNTGSALSFDAKISLLIDIGALNKIERNKFRAFMEIRNQFIHNISCRSYEDCFKVLKDRKSFILNLYKPEETISEEEHLSKGVEILYNDVAKTTGDLYKKLEEKIERDVRHKIDGILLQEIHEHLKTTKEKMLSGLKEEDSKGKTFTANEVSLLLKAYHTVVIEETKKSTSLKMGWDEKGFD